MITKPENTNYEKARDVLSFIRTADETMRCCELWIDDTGVACTRHESYDGPMSFKKSWNTRIVGKRTYVLETDHPDVFVNADCIYGASLKLMELKVQHAIFWANGSKSLYLIIYNFLPQNELSEVQRQKVRELFTMDIVEEKYHDIIDRKMFSSTKTMPLEFRKHCKYNTIFDLMYEYNPGAVRKNTSRNSSSGGPGIVNLSSKFSDGLSVRADKSSHYQPVDVTHKYPKLVLYNDM